MILIYAIDPLYMIYFDKKAFRRGLISQKCFWILMGEQDVSLDQLTSAVTLDEGVTEGMNPLHIRQERRPNVALIRRIPISQFHECLENAYNPSLIERLNQVFDCEIGTYSVSLSFLSTLQTNITNAFTIFDHHHPSKLIKVSGSWADDALADVADSHSVMAIMYLYLHARLILKKSKQFH